MTALVPTVGHLALIRFAANLVGFSGYVDVVVSGRSFEPVPLKTRIDALHEDTRAIERETGANIWINKHEDDNAPQNPSTPEEWDYWKQICRNQADGTFHDYVVASEPYGKKMADLLECEFVPFDIDRDLVPVKGSDVRENIQYRFDQIIPAMQKHLRQKVTIFGSESCGKTSTTLDLAMVYGAPHTKEFARPYLEAMEDKTITEDKMATIVRGQYALMRAAEDTGKWLTFHDTDLLSTIGYYRIFGTPPGEDTFIETRFKRTKSDLYIVLDTNIPFEPDPLRYGGDVRESDTQFWIDLLNEYDCNYYVVQSHDRTKRMLEAISVIDDHMINVFQPIMDFVRE